MVRDHNKPIGRRERFINPIQHKINYLQYDTDNHYDNLSCHHKHNGSTLHKSNIRNMHNFSRKRNYLLLVLKLFSISIVLTVIYGIYLDQRICNRINGKIWQLPAIVYSRMVSFEPNMLISKQEVVKILKATQYRQVLKITYPGEFTVKARSIEIIRRSFNFPDNKESQISVRLTFDSNRLLNIENIDGSYQLGLFRLDPRLITMFSSPNGEQRLFVARNSFPDLLIRALLATEDRHFYKHDGVSFYSIGRAMLANLTTGRKVQGASTLTQQLVKNLFLSRKRSYWRKLNEVYMALLMDARYSKDRILEIYMNEVYLGQNGDNEIHGFPLASLYYFGCPIEELSLDQQALLVGMVKGASIYNPWRNAKLATERRNLVLNLLRQQQIIDQKLYDILRIRPLGVQLRGSCTISPQPAFMQMVRQELAMKLGNKTKDLSGVKIFTTFDFLAQDAAEKAVIEGIPILKKQRDLKDLETAMVVVDKYSGEIRAMVGGAEPQYAGYNRAMQARRSIGSLAKPVTYITALNQPNRYRLNTWIADQPLFIQQPNGQYWTPKNEDRRCNGQVMLLDALIHSINIPTVNLGISLGLSAITDTWQKLGISRDQLRPVPAMILGALNLTPIEIAQVFQTIASGGNRALLSTVRSVIAENGKILYQSYPQAERTLPAQTAYMILWIMQQVVQYGTGHQLGEKYPHLHIAGKTGTTNNNVDTLFAGIDGCEVVITWVGRDNNQPTKLYGASGAMSIYQRYLSNRFPKPLDLVPPDDIVDMGIDEMGNFICSNGGRRLPVWTNSPDVLCQQSQFAQDTISDGNQFKTPKYQSYDQQVDDSVIDKWIKGIFN